MAKFEQQPMMEYGFIDLAGNTWRNIQVDNYNRYTNDINRATYEPDREAFLDRRHQYFRQVVNQNAGRIVC